MNKMLPALLLLPCVLQAANPHNFAFSETSDFKTFKHLGYFNQGVMKSTNFTSPKHGAVIHLTQEEADRLAARWGLEAY
ncbi:MAG: hypothetical protein JXR25_01280 [Pontiellaceae bacterium]|nr:hypothetical protein [Pontiellaceae bacterium]MBN2783432.1 hypothetical protein [Pontiellaceae bacterium]